MILGIIAAEIVVFVAAVQLFGGLAVLLATFGTAIAGGWLLRRQGLRALSSLGPRRSGEPATSYEAIVSGTWLALAGLLLIFPGFLADTAGILLIIRPVREFLTNRASKWFSVQSHPTARGPGWDKNGPLIEGEAVEVRDKPDDKTTLIR